MIQIRGNQRNRPIFAQTGFIGSFDAPSMARMILIRIISRERKQHITYTSHTMHTYVSLVSKPMGVELMSFPPENQHLQFERDLQMTASLP